MPLRIDRPIAIALAVFACICVSPPLAAAQPSSAMDAEAHGLFDAGTAAFDDGRLDDAYGYFTRAYELSGRAELLFNIASTCERLRRDREAITNYEQYLARVPNADNRRFVEGRLSFLREAVRRAGEEPLAGGGGAVTPLDPGSTPIDTQQTNVVPSETALSSAVEPSATNTGSARSLETDAPPSPRRRRVVLWTTLAVVVAGAVGAGVGLALRDPGLQGPIEGDVGPGGILVALVRSRGGR